MTIPPLPPRLPALPPRRVVATIKCPYIPGVNTCADIPPRLPALCPLKLHDDLQVHVLAPGMIRLDLYGDTFDGRACAIVDKAELQRITKRIANALAQA